MSRYVRKTIPLEIRAVQKTVLQQQQHAHPLPEAADEDLPADYTTTVNRAIASYNTEWVEGSSDRSSPANLELQSALAVSHGGWTTGNTTERSSVDSCYSLDEYDRKAASTVHQHFEEFESLLFEGSRDTTGSTVYNECQEWATQFPHLRVLGQQLMAPTDSGYNFVASDSSHFVAVPPSTSHTLHLTLSDQDLAATSDTQQGLTLCGHKVKAVEAPPESEDLVPPPQNLNHSSRDFGFLHEEVFAQDGVYEDVIAVDYKDIYEDNMEHKKQITPRRRHVGYPPITPNACVKDCALSGAFDKMWTETISWLRPLLKRYSLELEGKKSSGPLEHLDHMDHMDHMVLATQRPVRASSFLLTPRDAPDAMLPLLQVSKMALRDRHSQSNLSSMDMSEAAVLGESTHAAFLPVQQVAMSRPSTMHHPRRRLSHSQHLDPLREPSRISASTEDERRGAAHPSPQNALRVKQIVPGASHRLASPPAPMPGRLPPLEASASMPSQRKFGHRASSAMDNKEGRKQGGRERNNSSSEVSRPSTTQAFRSETPFGVHNLRSSAPMIHSIPARQLYVMGGNSGGLNVMGNGLYPSAEGPPNVLEDQEGPSVDRHTQWMPSAPSFSFFKPRRTLRN